MRGQMDAHEAVKRTQLQGTLTLAQRFLDPPVRYQIVRIPVVSVRIIGV